MLKQSICVGVITISGLLGIPALAGSNHELNSVVSQSTVDADFSGVSVQEGISIKTRASVNDPEAQYQLGVSLQDSHRDKKKSAEQAFLLFSQAAGKNGHHPGAQFELARAYFMGEGTDKNLIAAYIWSTLSSEQKSVFYEKASRLRGQVARLLNEQQKRAADQIVQNIR